MYLEPGGRSASESPGAKRPIRAIEAGNARAARSEAHQAAMLKPIIRPLPPVNDGVAAGRTWRLDAAADHLILSKSS